jgi:hypothetical protein
MGPPSPSGPHARLEAVGQAERAHELLGAALHGRRQLARVHEAQQRLARLHLLLLHPHHQQLHWCEGVSGSALSRPSCIGGDTPVPCLVRPRIHACTLRPVASAYQPPRTRHWPVTHLAACGIRSSRLEAPSEQLRLPNRALTHHQAVRADAPAGRLMRLLLRGDGLRSPAPAPLLAGPAAGRRCRGRRRLPRLRREHHDQVAERVRAVERAHVAQQASGVALHRGRASSGGDRPSTGRT